MKYSHRDNSEVAPEEAGVFWYLEPGEDKVNICDIDEKLSVWCPGNEVEYHVSSYRKGTRWWGPVIPPKVEVKKVSYQIVGINHMTGREVYWSGNTFTSFVMRARNYTRKPSTSRVIQVAEEWLGFVDVVKVKEVNF